MKNRQEDKKKSKYLSPKNVTSYIIKAVEGWIIIVTQLHEESMEDDIFDTFSKYGQVKSLHLNMDRRTGFAKGYALIEY